LITDYWENPSIHGAERLVALGWPFVKRELLRSNCAEDLSRLKEVVASTFNTKGQELEKFF
jgi:hypothetical protein